MNEKLRLLRGKRTQKFIASQLGITELSYHMLEKRDIIPRPPLLKRMMDFFGTTADHLFPQIEKMREQGKRMKLIEARWRLGLSIEEAAKCISISMSYLASIEAGKSNPSLDFQLKFEDFYGIRLEELFPELHVDEIECDGGR